VAIGALIFGSAEPPIAQVVQAGTRPKLNAGNYVSIPPNMPHTY